MFILGARKGLDLPDYPAGFRGVGSKGKRNETTVWEAIGDLPDIDRYPELLDSDLYRGKLGEPSRYAKIQRGGETGP